jgi:hypothetical protein
MSGSDSYPPPGVPEGTPAQPGGYYPPPGGSPPPPGYPPPGSGPPAGYPGYPGYPAGAAYPMPVAAHKPGAIPLRPLGLGDIYDAAFKIIRFNPMATVGSSVIVASVAMLIPLAVTGTLSATVGLSVGRLDELDNPQFSDYAGLLSAYGALLLGTMLSAIGLLMVTGMNAHVTLAAASGHKLGLGAAWQATHGKRWRLLLLTLVLFVGTVLVFMVAAVLVVLPWFLISDAVALLATLVLVPAMIFGVGWYWTRFYYLSVPPLMLERVGVFGAIRRAFRLTRRQAWRTFGIALLTAIVGQVAGSVLSGPASLIGQAVLVSDPNGFGAFFFVLTAAIGSVLSAAVVSPFVTTVASLQYVDQRIRKEAFDLELMARAGIIAS